MVVSPSRVAEKDPSASDGTRAGECTPGTASLAREEGAASERIAGALHDISNSLTVVLGLLQQALPAVEGEARGALSHAIERTRQAHRVARAAMGTPAPAPAPRSFGDVVGEIVAGLAAEAAEREVTLEHQLFPELRSAPVADPDALSRVLTNLLLNALQHSPSGGLVRLVGDVGRPEQALLSITDQGPGIAPELRAKVFKERFTTREDGGGVGLRTAAELARATGGGLRLVPSQRGAHFAVTWPFSTSGAAGVSLEVPLADVVSIAASSPPTPPPVGSTLHPPASGTLNAMRLLLVEDDPAIAEMLKAAFTARGATVRVVARRRDLEPALDESTYQGILLDLSPIADDVVGVLSAVHAKNPSARLLLISGSVEGLPTLAPEIFITWVQKPFELEDVVRALTARPALPTAADSA